MLLLCNGKINMPENKGGKNKTKQTNTILVATVVAKGKQTSKMVS